MIVRIWWVNDCENPHKTESVSEKRNPFWENGTRSGRTESVLGEQNPFWKNRTRSGKTESVLGEQNPFWKNRIRSWKTEIAANLTTPALRATPPLRGGEFSSKK